MTEAATKAADVVDEAARLIDPAIKPPVPHDLEKVTLGDMSYWVMNLRLGMRFKSGPLEGMDGDRAMITLTPADAAMLERISDSLLYVERERMKAKQDAGRKSSYGRR